jgi:hypothetical protein
MAYESVRYFATDYIESHETYQLLHHHIYTIIISHLLFFHAVMSHNSRVAYSMTTTLGKGTWRSSEAGR